MHTVNLTNWSAPRLHALGDTEAWKQSIDLLASVDFTPGWKRVKLITPENTIRRVSILLRGRRNDTIIQEHIPSSDSRFAAFIFVSVDIASIRIDLYLAAAAVHHLSATARPMALLEYLYKTLPDSLQSPVKFIRYFYDPPFVCAISLHHPRPDVHAVSVVRYDHWIRAREPRIQGDVLSHYCHDMVESPCICVLMPLADPNLGYLREAIDSVRSQTYANWKLRIAGNSSACDDTTGYLIDLPREDQRISVRLAESPECSPDTWPAERELEETPYVTVLDQHDMLARRSLEICAGLFSSNPSAEVVYTDHDLIDHDGRRRDPVFKPDFSLDLLYSYDYICCQIVQRAANVRKVGGWRKPFSCARDYDLTLRVLECVDSRQVAHIPAVLYHRRQETDLEPTETRARAAEFRSSLMEHLARRGISAEVRLTNAGFSRVRYDIGSPRPAVSIIIPTRDQPDLLEACVTSVLARTRYDYFEIIIVDNGSIRLDTRVLLSRLARIARVKVVEYPFDFNFAAINNFGRRHSDGTFLCFLNDDTEVIDADWLGEMLGYAVQPGAGCVGAKLLYPDGTVQHAGIILGVGTGALHAFRGFDGNAHGYAARLSVASNVSALTAACLLLRTSIFDAAGGFDETNFPITFNDVDLCTKVRNMGYRNILTPFARLYHHECRSRGYDDTYEKRARLANEFALLCARYGDRLRIDPFYSPNLSHENANFQLELADFPVGRTGSGTRRGRGPTCFDRRR